MATHAMRLVDRTSGEVIDTINFATTGEMIAHIITKLGSGELAIREVRMIDRTTDMLIRCNLDEQGVLAYVVSNATPELCESLCEGC